MRTTSLELPESTRKEAKRLALALGISRGEYFRGAIEKFNREVAAQVRATALARASFKVRAESMRINAEFDGF